MAAAARRTWVAVALLGTAVVACTPVADGAASPDGVHAIAQRTRGMTLHLARSQPGFDDRALRQAIRQRLRERAPLPARSLGLRPVSTWTSSPGAHAPGAVLVLVPTEQADGRSLADGCWVRLFAEENYGGDTLTLAGPVDLPRLHTVKANGDWDSAIAGPRATVRAYGDEEFRRRTATMQPGESVPDLRSDWRGGFDAVQSIQVSCG